MDGAPHLVCRYSRVIHAPFIALGHGGIIGDNDGRFWPKTAMTVGERRDSLWPLADALVGDSCGSFWG